MSKRRRTRKTGGSDDDLAPEYRFDRSKAKPNRFADALGKDAVVVVLDPDVARVFRDSRRVNALLRATIAAMRGPGAPRTG
jgi:hypothetical protein